MATRRPGRASIFTGETLRRRRATQADPAAALASLGGVIYHWDAAGDRLAWGPNASTILDLSTTDLPATGSAFDALIEPGCGTPRREASSRGGPYDLRYMLRVGPRSTLVVQDVGRCLPGPDGKPAFMRGFLRVDPEAQHADLFPRRVHERSAFLGRLQDDIGDSVCFSRGVTLIVCEIASDGSCGIREIMRRAGLIMRSRDHATMLSGSRFALALTSCAAADAPAALKRLTALLGGESGAVNLAAACAPDHALDACRLLALAQNALDHARPGSFAKICSPHPAGAPMRPPQEPFDVIEALNERTLRLVQSPIVEAHQLHQAFARAEATVAGHALRATSYDADTALLMDARKLELAANDLTASPDARIVLPIEVATLRNREWLSVLAAHLGARPGIASRLVLALPEAVLVEKSKVLGRLDAMKALGIGLSLEGFGSGHASGVRLTSLPIDLVTIDGVFIQALHRSTGDRFFVRTLIDMAQRLGIATSAEWVDDQAAAAMLREWGVDYLQGSLFGEMPAAAAIRTARRA